MINYFSEDTDFKLPDPVGHSDWIIAAIEEEGAIPGEINYIFCSDDYLLQINIDYLQHDFYTDIITFNSSEIAGIISGDLFLSIERIRENARSIGIVEGDELARVMIHGILHLLGYSDKTEKEVAVIRKKEDHFLSLRAF